MSFSYRIENFPQTKLIGARIRTTMAQAGTDCPALWLSFGPRLCGDLSKFAVGAKATYGVSRMIDEETFDYWALIETQIEDLSSLPDNIESFTIEEGLFVRAEVDNLEQLGAAFNALYSQWPQTQTEYTLNMHGICFEYYPIPWQPTDAFAIYAPVIRKT